MSALRWLRWLGAGSVLLASRGLLLAETNSPALGGLSSSPLASLTRVLGAFAIVLAVFGALIWVLKNWQRFVVHRGLPMRLRVLEAKSLGQRHVLYVVSYEEQRLLLAASPTGVSLLTHLPSGPVEQEKGDDTAPASQWATIFERVVRANHS